MGFASFLACVVASPYDIQSTDNIHRFTSLLLLIFVHVRLFKFDPNVLHPLILYRLVK